MFKKITLVALGVLLFISCQEKLELKAPELSFYYWRTTFTLDSVETDYLKDLEVDKLYVRYFDVGIKNNQVIPIRPIVFKDSLKDKQIIPVVFIKNQVVLKSDLNIDALSDNILGMIGQINTKNNFHIHEIQLDCDWSDQSKENFFALVDKIKQKSKLKVSTTIRLHQVKFAHRTGIPPSDDGVLMYYNMGSISSDTLNSIYDRDIALQYVQSLKSYPMELKYAVPIYSWIIHIKENQVLGLLPGMHLDQLQGNPDLRQIGESRFLVESETILSGRVLKPGQELKLETTDSIALKQMLVDLKKASGRTTKEIILYDLSSRNLQLYEKDFLQTLATDL